MRRSSLGALAIVLACAVFTGPLARAEGQTSYSYPGTARYSVPVSKLDRALRCFARNGSPTSVKTFTGRGRSEPVLLVHGLGVTPEQNWGWNYAPALIRAGFEVCWITVPHGASGDIQISAEYAARAIQVMSRVTHEKVDVLGHSEGGLISRWALKWFPSSVEVDDYIALDSPQHGTLVADAVTAIGSSIESAWQMRTVSKFVAALNDADETPGRISYSSVYTATSELVQPIGTQALEGASNVMTQDVCPPRPVTHITIENDGMVWLLVTRALTHAGEVDPGKLPADACQATTVPGATYPPAHFADYGDGGFASEEPPLKPYARLRP